MPLPPFRNAEGVGHVCRPVYQYGMVVCHQRTPDRARAAVSNLYLGRRRGDRGGGFVPWKVALGKPHQQEGVLSVDAPVRIASHVGSSQPCVPVPGHHQRGGCWIQGESRVWLSFPAAPGLLA